MISANTNEVPGSTLHFINDPLSGSLQECRPSWRVHVYAQRHGAGAGWEEQPEALQVSCTPPLRPRCGCSCESPSCSCCSSTGTTLSLDRQRHPARWTQSLDTDRRGLCGMRLEAKWPVWGDCSFSHTHSGPRCWHWTVLSLFRYSSKMPFKNFLSIDLFV